MKIVSAAIRLKSGLICSVPCPYRHPDIITAIYALTDKTVTSQNIQGFLTSEGHFVRRTEAYKIAEQANQLLPAEARPDAHLTIGTLYTEDLW